ncbi:MAG: response regulator [Rhodobacteraceae bacterium]|nr:response regulator [Paracoccaceae bacterium]
MDALPKILHVDDDLFIREIVRICLESVGGLAVEQCASGYEALERAPEVQPDLFLLDVMMPDMSGEDTLVALRALPEFATTPVIFLTALAHPAEIRKLTQAGAVGVITKPFDPMTLSTQVLELWRSAL